MAQTKYTRRTVLGSAALAATTLTMPFLRGARAAEKIVPKGKMTLAWHTNIAARWLDPRQHDGTASPDNFLMALHDGLIKNFRDELYDHLALADRFEFAEDAKSATFWLREGIQVPRWLAGHARRTSSGATSIIAAPGARLLRERTDQGVEVGGRHAPSGSISRSRSSISRSCWEPANVCGAGWVGSGEIL